MLNRNRKMIEEWFQKDKGAVVVEHNWQVDKREPLQNVALAESFMKQVNQVFVDKYGFEVFAKSDTVSRLVKGAYIDVVAQDEEGKLIAADVYLDENATGHRGGLQEVRSFVKRILTKALVLATYFPGHEAEIVVAVADLPRNPLKRFDGILDTVEELLAEFELDYAVKPMLYYGDGYELVYEQGLELNFQQERDRLKLTKGRESEAGQGQAKGEKREPAGQPVDEEAREGARQKFAAYKERMIQDFAKAMPY